MSPSAPETLARLLYCRLASLPLASRATESELAIRLRRALRQSGLVRESVRYAMAASFRASGVRRYHLSQSGKPVLLRHPADSWTFEEIFRAQAYDPPREVLQALDRLGRAPRILDLGANVGLFTRWAAGRWPRASIEAMEPDPVNAAIFRRSFDSGEVDVRLDEACAGTAAGQVVFAANGSARSHVLPPGERDARAISRPAIDALPLLARADFAKVDVEGAEWDLLADPRLRAAGPQALVLEFHSAGCPGEDPAGEARAALHAAGYRIVDSPRPFAEDEFPNGQGMVWGVRNDAPEGPAPR